MQLSNMKRKLTALFWFPTRCLRSPRGPAGTYSSRQVVQVVSRIRELWIRCLYVNSLLCIAKGSGGSGGGGVETNRREEKRMQDREEK